MKDSDFGSVHRRVAQDGQISRRDIADVAEAMTADDHIDAEEHRILAAALQRNSLQFDPAARAQYENWLAFSPTEQISAGNLSLRDRIGEADRMLSRRAISRTEYAELVVAAIRTSFAPMRERLAAIEHLASQRLIPQNTYVDLQQEAIRTAEDATLPERLQAADALASPSIPLFGNSGQPLISRDQHAALVLAIIGHSRAPQTERLQVLSYFGQSHGYGLMGQDPRPLLTRAQVTSATLQVLHTSRAKLRAKLDVLEGMMQPGNALFGNDPSPALSRDQARSEAVAIIRESRAPLGTTFAAAERVLGRDPDRLADLVGELAVGREAPLADKLSALRSLPSLPPDDAFRVTLAVIRTTPAPIAESLAALDQLHGHGLDDRGYLLQAENLIRHSPSPVGARLDALDRLAAQQGQQAPLLGAEARRTLALEIVRGSVSPASERLAAVERLRTAGFLADRGAYAALALEVLQAPGDELATRLAALDVLLQRQAIDGRSYAQVAVALVRSSTSPYEERMAAAERLRREPARQPVLDSAGFAAVAGDLVTGSDLPMARQQPEADRLLAVRLLTARQHQDLLARIASRPT